MGIIKTEQIAKVISSMEKSSNFALSIDEIWIDSHNFRMSFRLPGGLHKEKEQKKTI